MIGKIPVRHEIDRIHREVDAADDPAALFGLHVIVVREDPFGHHPGIVAVEYVFARAVLLVRYCDRYRDVCSTRRSTRVVSARR